MPDADARRCDAVMARVALLWRLSWWFSLGGVSTVAAYASASWIPVAVPVPVAPLRRASPHHRHRLARQPTHRVHVQVQVQVQVPSFLLQQTKGTGGDSWGDVYNGNDAEAEDWEKIEIPDSDGIGAATGTGTERLFVLPTESNMLRHVTNYLRNQQELAETLTGTSGDDDDDFDDAASDWLMPKPTIVSFRQFMSDSYEENGESTDVTNSNTTSNTTSNNNNNNNNNSNTTSTAAPVFVSSTASRLLESSRARQHLVDKKAKAVTDFNSVFERYKNGNLSPLDGDNSGSMGTAAGNDTGDSDSGETPQLPPFPSRQHCIGFWRMIQSPTGFEVESSRSSNETSDNLILRVDGTIAGGPILDQELRHKAAGGHWDITTTRDTNCDNGQSSSAVTAILRVELIIPPSKNRMLVMEGQLQQIPSNETHQGELSVSPLDNSILQCAGSVWVQDVNVAVTESSHRHRDEVGTFCMHHLPQPKDRQVYTITVPRNIRPGD